MNRRDAVEAIMSLPEVQRVEHVSALKPRDVVIVYADQDVVTPERSAEIAKVLTDVWPGQTVLVFDKALRVQVMVGKEAVKVDTPVPSVVLP